MSDFRANTDKKRKITRTKDEKSEDKIMRTNDMGNLRNMKEYLNQGLFIDKRIDANKNKIEYYRGRAELAANIFSAEKVRGGTGARSRMEDCMCKIDELEKAVARDLEKLAVFKAKIEEIVSRVKRAEYRQVLELRYISGKTLQQVADETGYCYRHVTRLRNKALESIAPDWLD